MPIELDYSKNSTRQVPVEQNRLYNWAAITHYQTFEIEMQLATIQRSRFPAFSSTSTSNCS